MESWVVAIIFSNWELSKIYNFLYDYLEAKNEDIGISKIERYRDKHTREMRDSNRTLILLKKTIFEKATNLGLNVSQRDLDFRIAEYIIKDKAFPTAEYSSDFYLIIPKNIKYTEIQQCILDKMKNMVNFGMLKSADFSLKIPLESRLTGEHRGCAYMLFDSLIDIKTKIYIKALLQDSFIYLNSINKLYHLPVIWARKNTVENTKIIIPKIIKILKKE